MYGINQRNFVQSQQWKHQNNVWNLFKANNKDIERCQMKWFVRIVNGFQPLTSSNIVLMSLLLTLNRFRTLFWCFHCWRWTIKQWLRNIGSTLFHVVFLYVTNASSKTSDDLGPCSFWNTGSKMNRWNKNEIVISATHDKQRLLSLLKPQASWLCS